MDGLLEDFETARLRLRPPSLDDAEAILSEYAQDQQVTKYVGWRCHAGIETVREFLINALKEQARGTRRLWVITEKQADRAIGMADAKLQGFRVSFGYVLARRLWGNGYMPEALQPLVASALAQPNVHRVWAFCDTENKASARVLEKIGMQREGILRRWFIHPNVSEIPRDCLCYAIVKETERAELEKTANAHR